MKTNQILQGDALTKLKELPNESINCVMTSPPYWALRDYGTANWEGGDINCKHEEAKEKSRFDYEFKETEATKGRKLYEKGSGGDAPHWKDRCPSCGAVKVDKQLGLESTFDEYINKLCNIFDEVKRVLRKDGTCWVNLGDTYYTKSGSGFIDDNLTKDDRMKNQIDLEGNKINDTDEVKVSNTTGINKANELREGGQLPSKTLTLIPQRFAIEMVSRGWILRNNIIWHKPNCMPSSVKDRFTVDFEYLFFFVKNKKYWFETQYEPHQTQENRPDGIVREREFGYDTKYPEVRGFKNKPNIKQPQTPQKHGQDINYGKQGRNKRCIWQICPKPFKEAHFAVYPEELCETPIKAGCPEGGIVLDPFFGAGTTGLVALKQNKKFIGIELNKEYIGIANKRLKPYIEQTKLFASTHEGVSK